MPLQVTEDISVQAMALDTRAPEDILTLLHQAQLDAATAVFSCITEISVAAETASNSILSGGRLIYAAAGSSGLMALADGLELPGTFGLRPDQIIILLAGGVEQLQSLPGGPEDDMEQASRDIERSNLGNLDCVIAVSASGTTPYALAALRAARERGASTIGIANNAPTPLLSEADVAIHLATPPEIVAGSTRMGAGTAQKITLNMLSTLMAVHLGHVHDGHMVNLLADNTKLKVRASRIVSTIAGCSAADADRHLTASGGAVKIATLLASGAATTDEAERLLAANDQKLRPALVALGRP